MNLSVNITTISNSFCRSYTSYFSYLASSASFVEKSARRMVAHEKINHFVRKFAKPSPILKILSLATE